MEPILLSITNIANYFGVEISTAKQLVESPRFPAPFVFGKSTRRWRREDVDGFLNHCCPDEAGKAFIDRGRLPWDTDATVPEVMLDITEEVREYVGFPPCVYFLIDKGQLTYIGETVCLPVRLAAHRKGTPETPRKEFDRVLFVAASGDNKKRKGKESFYIRKFRPALNRNSNPRKRPGQGG